MGQPFTNRAGTGNTIGDWTITTLTKVITDIFTRNPPRNLPNLDCDRLVIHEDLTVEKNVTFLGQDFHAVGTSGNPPFQNSWVNYGSPYTAASFVRAPDGWVRLHGLIKNPGSPVTLPSTAFTLPPGYRPEGTCIFNAIALNAIGRIDIDTNGNVMVSAPTNTTAPWISLDGITFKAP